MGVVIVTETNRASARNREEGTRAVTHLLLEYTLSEDYLERRPQYREEHLALLRDATDRGVFVLGGALTEPWDRALLVWTGVERAEVEEFVRNDPYVKEGLVLSWEIRTWAVAIGTAFAG
jgi:uncharacterized protein YciI